MAKKKKAPAKKKTPAKKKAPARKAKAPQKAPKKTAAKKTVTKKASPSKKAATAGAVAKKPAAPAERVLPTPTPASGVSLRSGQRAPAFELPADTGEVISLESLKGKKVVLYFYPKDDTPGCTQEACDFRDNFARLQSAGAVVLGVSKDTVELHKKFKSKHSLPFPLLADVKGQMVQDYGVWKEKSMYGRTYMGIERTTFLIDGEGKIRKIYPKVKVTGHVDEVLKDIKAL